MGLDPNNLANLDCYYPNVLLSSLLLSLAPLPQANVERTHQHSLEKRSSSIFSLGVRKVTGETDTGGADARAAKSRCGYNHPRRSRLLGTEFFQTSDLRPPIRDL